MFFPVKTPTLLRALSPLWISLALLCCAAKPVSPPVIAQGNNTFSITREGTNAFQRDIDKLKSEVQEDATKYCAEQGKQLKVISLTGEKPLFSLGYIKAKIVFKALNPGEIDPTPVAGEAAPASPTGDLYSDLIKLDDLRKKGILTDEEFQAEKKKVLSRSK